MRNNKGNVKMMVLCILLSISTAINAQTRYWVGGSGNWTDKQHWASTSGGNGGESLPTSSSNVIINDNSGLSEGGNIVLTGNVEVGALLWFDAPQSGFSGNYAVTVNKILDFNSNNGWAGTINLASKEKSIAIFSSAQQKYNVNFLQSSIYTLGSNLSTTGKVDVSKAKDVILGNYSIDAKSYKKKRSLLKATVGEVETQSQGGITINYKVTPVKCDGASTGAIDIVSVEGPTGNITYKWFYSNVQIGEEDHLEGASTGIYKLRMSDQSEPIKIATFEIVVPSTTVNIWDDLVMPKKVSCFGGEPNGSIRFYVD